MRFAFAVLAAIVMLAGCHTIDFEISRRPTSHVVHERKSFFLFGLVPGNLEVDVREHCPNGATHIREATSFTDGLFTFVFIGIWELRSTWYHCAAAEESR